MISKATVATWLSMEFQSITEANIEKIKEFLFFYKEKKIDFKVFTYICKIYTKTIKYEKATANRPSIGFIHEHLLLTSKD